MAFGFWILPVCAVIVIQSYGAAGAKCHVCKLALNNGNGVANTGIPSHVSCPDLNDATTTTQMNCVDTANAPLPCVTFVGTQFWTSSGGGARDSVVRLCLDEKAEAFLGTTLAQRDFTQCFAAEFNIKPLPDSSVIPARLRGLGCSCDGDLCNNRYNVSRYWGNSAHQTSFSWTSTTAMLLLVFGASLAHVN